MKRLFAIFARHLIAPFLEKFCVGEVKGTENIPREGSFIIAPNHQSYFDHFFAPYILREKLEKVSFIGKMETKWQALQWGWFYWLAEVIPVNRKSKDRRKVLIKALEVLKRGGIIIIYPEGTRNKKRELLRGKTGIAELAVKSGAPVIPLGLIYKNNKPPALPVKIKVGAPLYFKKSDASGYDLRKATDEVMGGIARVSGKEVSFSVENSF